MRGRAEQLPYVHFIATAIMFLVLAGFCLIFYRHAITKKATQLNHKAGRRARVYALSGIVIVAAILTLAVDALFGRFISHEVPRLVFYGEFAVLLAFGASWLTASHTVPLLAQKQERPQYFA
jgi:predicted lysophospholipase L1 biosynthesis ABC-type transport system permease subunit